jgi:hypothetical protein
MRKRGRMYWQEGRAMREIACRRIECRNKSRSVEVIDEGEREVQARPLETELEREGRICQFLKWQGKRGPPCGPS